MPLAAASLAVWLAALSFLVPQPGAQKPQAKAARPTAPAAAGPFQTTLSVAQMTGKQAVLETSQGTIVIDLRPDLAPNHVGYFMKLAGERAYDGTIFHRVVRLGIVQGGDPLTKDPSKASLSGTGGLGMLKAEH